MSHHAGRAYFIYFSQLERWTPLQNAIEQGDEASSWTPVSIDDLVTQIESRVTVLPDSEYGMAGVKWYAEGVFHRETVLGRDMSAKYVTPLIPGALIYNRLFAWKESFAVVQPEHSGLFVSNEFPQFQVNVSKALPEFLYLFCTIPTTIKQVNAASAGSAAVSRNRFKEAEFIKFKLRLPPLATQQAIVEHWQAAQKKNAAALQTANKHEAEIRHQFLSRLGLGDSWSKTERKAFALKWSALPRWSIEYLQRKNSASSGFEAVYQTKQLREIATGRNGSTPNTRNPEFWHGTHLWVSPKDMKSWEITDTQDKITQAALNNSTAPLIRGPSILMVMRSGILQHNVPVAFTTRDVSINQDMRAFTIRDTSIVEPEYLAHYLQHMTHELLSLVKWGVTVQSMNTDDLEGFQIVLPPLPLQRQLVAAVNAARAKIAAERAAAAKLAADTAREVEEMILGHRPVPTP